MTDRRAVLSACRIICCRIPRTERNDIRVYLINNPMMWKAMNHGCLILVTLIHISPALSCLTKSSQAPILGSWCKINDDTQTIKIFNVLRHQCVLQCMMTQGCFAVSHNFIRGFCILGLRLCNEVASHPEFTLSMYGWQGRGNSTCTQWKPVEDYDPSTAIEYHRIPTSSDMFTVGRKLLGDSSYPGKFKRYGRLDVSACDETTKIGGGIEEYLAVDYTSCMFAWVPFNNTDEVPEDAVKGGFDGEDELIVARVFYPNQSGMPATSIGYYNPTTRVGYFYVTGVCGAWDTMEILTLLWDQWKWYLFSCEWGMSPCWPLLCLLSGLILGLRPANERPRYKVTPSLSDCAQTWNQPCTILVPNIYVKSLTNLTIGNTLISSAGARSSNDLAAWEGARMIAQAMTTRSHVPLALS